MTKYVHDEVLDAALDEIRDNATLLVVCSQYPTTRTEAVSTYALADVIVDASDFTKADGDTSGRKLTVAAQDDVPIDTGGTATHVAICDPTRLLYVNEITSQQLNAGGTTDLPEWDIELRDPS